MPVSHECLFYGLGFRGLGFRLESVHACVCFRVEGLGCSAFMTRVTVFYLLFVIKSEGGAWGGKRRRRNQRERDGEQRERERER